MKYGIVPLFKGDVPPISGEFAERKRRDNSAVMTGLNPDTGSLLHPQMYLDTLARVAREQRQIAENVARIFAATLSARDALERDHQAQLFFFEGCQWDWNMQKPMNGCEVSRSIFNAVPESMRRNMPEPFVRPESRRTRDEMNALFYYERVTALRCDELVAVTHPYHAFRARQIGNFVHGRQDYSKPFDVQEPSQIASLWRMFHDKPLQPDAQFMLDAIRIGEPTTTTNLFREGPKEIALLGLHIAERITGNDYEGEILKKMSVRQGSSEKMPK